MNERIRELAKQAGLPVIDGEWDYNDREILCQVDGEWRVAAPSEIISVLFDCEKGREKFAELIVEECVNQALEEKVSEEEIDKEDDIEDRCYLRGNNGGIVDAVIRIKQHFGVEQ